MLKHAQNPSIAPSDEPIFDALIRIEAADGLMTILHNSLAFDDSQLDDLECVGCIDVINNLLNQSISLIGHHTADHRDDCTEITGLIEGVQASLQALRSAYLELCDRANNRIQMAMLHGLSLILGVCMAHLSTYELEGSSV